MTWFEVISMTHTMSNLILDQSWINGTVSIPHAPIWRRSTSNERWWWRRIWLRFQKSTYAFFNNTQTLLKMDSSVSSVKLYFESDFKRSMTKPWVIKYDSFQRWCLKLPEFNFKYSTFICLNLIYSKFKAFLWFFELENRFFILLISFVK